MATFAYLHCLRKLTNYGEYINSLFAVTNPTFHVRVISFDEAVRQRVGATCDLKLSEHDRFLDIKLAHIDSIGTSVTLSSQTSGNKSNKIFI